MSARQVAIGLALGCVGLAACNALTGADEPEIVDAETVSAGPGLTTTGTASSGADATSGAAGGHDDRDVVTGPETPPSCGDGARVEGEECDDGNVVAGDGCSDLCHLECGEREARRLSRGTCVAASAEDDARTWDDAASACSERGGALVLLDDLDVAMFDGRLDGLHHVGARRADDGAFEWLDGSTVDEDVVIFDEEGNDCLTLDLGGEHGAGPLLRAVPCDDRLRYLCERAPGAGG